MTLGQAFTWAIELEAGYQLSEGVSLARHPEIMQVQEIEEVDKIGAMQRRLRDVVCWGCGDKGHLYRDCPHRRENMHDDECDDSNEYDQKKLKRNHQRSEVRRPRPPPPVKPQFVRTKQIYSPFQDYQFLPRRI